MNSGKVRMSLYTAGGLVGLCASAYAVSQVPPFDYSGIKGGKDTYDLIGKHDSAAQKFEHNFEVLSEELNREIQRLDNLTLYDTGFYYEYFPFGPHSPQTVLREYERVLFLIKENQEHGKEIAAYRKDVESLREWAQDWAQYTDPWPITCGSVGLGFVSVISLFAAAGLFDKKIPEANKTP